MNPGEDSRICTPHKSGADLFLTVHLTDPDLDTGRMVKMLRNERRYTTVVDSLPRNLDLASGQLGKVSLFGAGEYAKDGLLAVTEPLGRNRMVDMTADVMKLAPVESCCRRLPAPDAEFNGDLLQVLVGW